MIGPTTSVRANKRKIIDLQIAEADTDGDGVVSPRDRNSLYVFFVGEERLQRVHPESINAGELVSVSASADRKSSWIVFRGKDDSEPSRGQRLFVYHVEKKHLEELRDGATP